MMLRLRLDRDLALTLVRRFSADFDTMAHVVLQVVLIVREDVASHGPVLVGDVGQREAAIGVALHTAGGLDVLAVLDLYLGFRLVGLLDVLRLNQGAGGDQGKQRVAELSHRSLPLNPVRGCGPSAGAVPLNAPYTLRR